MVWLFKQENVGPLATVRRRSFFGLAPQRTPCSAAGEARLPSLALLLIRAERLWAFREPLTR
jgi:hypothetical protein